MSRFASLRFRFPFRRYQRMVLDLAAERTQDRKFHIVAPPGSGKTIIGLELIRRFGRPAVVFCPTTTIQRQWREKVGLFTADPAWIESHTSLDPRRLADINLLTYQVLSTPGENLEFVERIALDRWVDDLLSSDQAQTEAEARQRLATLRTANPPAYRREVAKRYRRVKRDFLREGKLAGREFLHPNARDLIDRIVALGTGTVVLDECHHLLDYWAFILRELLHALPNVRVIGLTATLPDPANKREYENYTALLGEVDFEVPTPAVVKEGNLAPYRDLVYFCEPSPREQDYLHQIQHHFEGAVWQVTQETAFQDWLWGLLFPETDSSGFENLAALLKDEPLLCIAAVKYLLELGVPLPLDVPIIEEMLEPLGMDDWLTLMENYALRALKVSADPRLQALYRELRDALLPFGITISEQGIRHYRSPGDLVLALSEAKDEATVNILRAEAEALEGRLRAVVLTDYERLSARTRRLKGILDPDAGSAVRVFRRLVADPVTGRLRPVLVTGKMVLAGARGRALLEGGIRRWMAEQGADFQWEWKETENEEVLRLVGQGPDWSSRTYVALLTDLFEAGLTQCLVGTRGILGEGWDSLRLNTLVDLTSVTTRTAVQQIRGRSIRLDPDWQRKVAHNWDVVCVSREFDKGNADLRRFVARHRHTWGIVTPSSASWGEKIGVRRQSRSLVGQIVRGVAHVDLHLATELAQRDFRRLDYAAYTRRSLDAPWEREQVYELWAVGQPYDNIASSVSQVKARDLKFRTALTVQGALGAAVRRVVGSALVVGGLVWVHGALVVPWAALHALPQVAAAAAALGGAAALTTLGVNGYGLWQVFRRAFLELPADAVLGDMGRALLAALRDVGLIGGDVEDGQVRVVEMEGGYYQVSLVGAAPEESDAFARAYQQLLGPLGEARYLIERDGASLRNWAYRPLWFLVRKALRLEEDLKAYHRVPDPLASRRERAEALARYWRRYVGGGRLIYTRTVEGRRLLLAARAQRRPPLRQMAFEVWR